MIVATVVTGVGAGVGGALLTLLLHLVEHLSFGYSEGSFLDGVERASSLRRVLALGVGGLITGTGWWLQRRHIRTDVSVPRALADESRRLPFGPSIVDSLLQIGAVGAGASLGREGAPRLLGAASGAWIARHLAISGPQRKTLIACGAGAGFAAVYNVPLGGALFALEILLGSFGLLEIVPALASSAIATVIAWPVLGNHVTYHVAQFSASGRLVVWSILLGPVAGLVAAAFRGLTIAAQSRTPSGWRVIITITVTLAALGGLAISYPQLLGNGKSAAQVAFDGGLALPLMLALVVLKPLATTACLQAGARGGLLTPALATGAVLGGAGGDIWSHMWPGTPVGAYALLGAAAVLAAAQRAPLTGVVLTIEFTHSGLPLLVPMALAVTLAVGTAALVDRGAATLAAARR